MDGFNSVTLCGTLGGDPEYSQITSKASGKTTPKAVINMVTNRTYKDASGNKQQDSHWHTVEVWGVQADVVKNYTRKGHSLLVEGELRYDSWVDKETQKKRTKAYVHARKLTLLPNQRDAQGAQAPAQNQGQQQQPQNQGQPVQQNQAQQNVNEYAGQAQGQPQGQPMAQPQGQSFNQQDFNQPEGDLPF